MSTENDQINPNAGTKPKTDLEDTNQPVEKQAPQPSFWDKTTELIKNSIKVTLKTLFFIPIDNLFRGLFCC